MKYRIPAGTSVEVARRDDHTPRWQRRSLKRDVEVGAKPVENYREFYTYACTFAGEPWLVRVEIWHVKMVAEHQGEQHFVDDQEIIF